MPVLNEQLENAPPIPDYIKASALLLLHSDLKTEYLMEENPRTLWLALKRRYEQRKSVILPHANYEWAHLRLQDFKSVDDINHALHKICSKLKFCDKEPTDEEKIEKTLSTMLPADRLLQQQFRQHNFQVYSELIQILIQAEKYDELLVKNHHRLPIGAAPPPMPEVNYTV